MDANLRERDKEWRHKRNDYLVYRRRRRSESDRRCVSRKRTIETARSRLANPLQRCCWLVWLRLTDGLEGGGGGVGTGVAAVVGFERSDTILSQMMSLFGNVMVVVVVVAYLVRSHWPAV